MTAEGELQYLYGEWRRLAEAEGKAIREGSWGFVAECQQAISQLRPAIDKLIQQVSQDRRKPGTDKHAGVSFLRAIVLELIELQRRNLASLEQRKQRLSSHIEQLGRAGRNLRGIQRSYAPPATDGWSFYS